MKKEILLIRHGQGDHNRLVAENRIDESLALRGPALNDIGIQQAESLGVKLKEKLYEFIVFIKKHRLSNFQRGIVLRPIKMTFCQLHSVVLSFFIFSRR